MENNALIDALPLWGLFIAILGVVLLSVECGYRLGKFRLSRREQEKEARDAEQAAVQNIKTLRRVKMMRLKISARSDEVRTAV